MPVYNEADFLPQALPALIGAMNSLDRSYEILIVENGSTDGSAAIASSVAGDAPVSILSLQIADYGSAMHHGFLQSTGDWVVNFDIDYFSAEFLRKVLASREFDIVIGSKRDPGSEDRRPMIRRLATLVFNLLLRTILSSKVSDTHGMKAFRRELVEDLAPQVVSRKDLYDTELVIRAERAGYKVTEVPVIVEELRTARSALVKRVPRTIAGLFRIRKLLKRGARPGT
ncbi:MAG: glycosyltransferase family 2 protein [Acidimicrobiia bacterium]